MMPMPFKSTDLESHAQALSYLLMKAVVNSSAQWKKAGSEIKELADCLSAYNIANILVTKKKLWNIITSKIN